MKTRYFFNKILIFGMLLCATLSIAQSFIISFPNFSTAPTANPRDLSVCQNTSELQVQMDVLAASASGATVTIQLGTGVEYVPGSLAVVSTIGGLTITENGGTPNAPQFTIGPNNLAVSNRIVFTIGRRATCVSRTHALALGTFLDKVTGTIPGQTASTANSSAYTVHLPDVGVDTTASLPLANTVVGGTYSRNFLVTNGSATCATTAYFTVDYPKISGVQAIVPNSLKIIKWGNVTLASPITLTALSTTSTASSTTMLYSLSGTQLPPGGLCNSSVTITENFTLKACSGANIQTTYKAGYGCDSAPANWCNTQTGYANLTTATGVPSLASFSAARSNFTSACNSFTETFTWTAGGSGNATAATMHNVNLQVQSNWNNFSIQSATINGQPVTIIPGGLNTNATFTLRDIFTSDPDGVGIGLDDIDGDGFFDDLAPGKTVTIVATIKENCGVYSCNQNNGSGVMGNLSYSTMCSPTSYVQSTQYTSNTSGFSNAYLGLGATSYAPSNVSGGIPFKARFAISAQSLGNDFWNANTRFTYNITLPAGVSLVSPQTTTVWHDGYYPSNFANTSQTATITQSGNVVTVTSPTKNYGWIELNLVYDCGAAPGGNNIAIDFTINVIQDITTNCSCNGNLACGKLILQNVICDTTPCALGPKLTFVKVEREDNSLGWTDTTLSTIQSRSNINDYDLSKILYLDDFFVKSNAIINGSLNNLYLHFSIKKINAESGDKILAKSLDVVIKRNGAVISSGNVGSFTNTGSSTSVQAVNWNLSALIPSGGLLNGDIIETIAHYNASSNNYPTHDVASGNSIYFYSLDTSNNVFSCNNAVPEMYLVGTNFDDKTNAIVSSTGCSGNNLGAGIDYIARRFDLSGVSYINEIRPGIFPTTMSFTIDPRYKIDKVTVSPYNGMPFTVLTQTSNVGNTYYYNLPNTLAYNIVVSNAYNFIVSVIVVPTCASDQNLVASPATMSTKINYVDYYYYYKKQPVLPAEKTSGRTFNVGYNSSTKPTITLLNQTGNIQASKPQESFVVRMASTGTNTAPFTWLAIPSASGVNIQQVVDVATGTSLTPINYSGGVWFQLSNAGLAPGATKDFRIDFKYTTCSATTFPVLAGWNCTEFPTDPTTYTCDKSIVNLIFTPQSASIQIAAVTQPTSANLCDVSTYQYRISSTGPGNTVSNKFNITLPTGMSIVPGTAKVEYPLGSGNWQSVSVSTSSNVTTLDLTTHPGYDTVNGLPGTLNDGGNSNLRFMDIKFDVVTDCTFVSGSRLVVSANAKKTCGEPAVGDGTLLNATSLNINGVAPTYYVTTAISQSPNSFTNCNVSTITIDHTIVTSTSTGSSGSIEVFIPQGYTYDSSSFNCNSTYCPTYIGTFTDTASGNQYLKYSIPAGMTTSQTMSYSMSFTPTNAVICGDKTLLVRTVDEFTGIACATAPGGTCGSITTETGYKEYNYTVTKPTLDIVSVSGSNSGGTYSGSITIKNTSTVNQTASSPSNPVKINFYCADDAGNATGQLLGTYTLTGTIAAGATITENFSFTGVVCTTGTRIFAAVETSNNCVCSADRNTLFCFKPSLETGTALETKHGITALGRAGSENSNWPMIRKGAWTALEANTKGFVINRLTDAQVAAIPASNLVIGMTVYNITQDCLMINTTGTASGWKCLRNQGCPD